MTGRARQRLSPEARREQLETAAIEVVARDGYSGATAEAIVGKAGASKGLLWHYYADLDELMVAAARRALTLVESAVADDLDRDAPTPELLRRAIGRAARLPASHGSELRAIRQIVGNLAGRDESAGLGTTEYEGLHARQAALLRDGQTHGHLRADLDPGLLAVMYQGMVDTMLDHLDQHPDVDPSEFAEQVATVLLDGITA